MATSIPFDYKSLVELYRENSMNELSKEAFHFLKTIVLGQNPGLYASRYNEHMRWDNPAKNHPDYDYYRILDSIIEKDYNGDTKYFFKDLFDKWHEINQKDKKKNFEKVNKDQIKNVIESLKDPSKFDPSLFKPTEEQEKKFDKRNIRHNLEYMVLKSVIYRMLSQKLGMKDLKNIFPELDLTQNDTNSIRDLSDLLASYIWVNEKFRNSVLVDLYSRYSK